MVFEVDILPGCMLVVGCMAAVRDIVAAVRDIVAVDRMAAVQDIV